MTRGTIGTPAAAGAVASSIDGFSDAVAGGYVTHGQTVSVSALNTAMSTLSSGGGGVMWLGTGSYGLQGTVQVPANVQLVGAGKGACTLTFTGSPTLSSTAVALTGAYARVEGVTINVTEGDYQRGIGFRASNGAAVNNKVNFTTTGTTAAAYGIYWSAGSTITDVLVEGNEVTSSGVATEFGGMLGTDCRYLRVIGNYIHDITNSSNTRLNWGIYASNTCHGVLIQGNVVHTCDASGIHLGGSTPNDEYGRRVIGNYVSDCEWTGIGVDDVFNAVVSGNVVRRCDQLLYVDPNAQNVAVTGNTFEEVVTATAGATDSEKPMVAVNGFGHTITGNSFDQRGDAIRGLKLDDSGHTAVGNSFGTTRPRIAIYQKSTGSRMVIADNNIDTTDDTTAAAAVEAYGAYTDVRGNMVRVPNGCYGIRVGGSTGYVNAEDNTIYGETTASRGVWVNGTNNVVRRNKILGTVTTPVHQSSNTGSVIQDNLTGSGLGMNYGVSTQNGTGAQTAFTITHGLYTTPTSWNVTPGSADAAALFRVTASSTQLTVTFTAAPASGTGNVVLYWQARV